MIKGTGADNDAYYKLGYDAGNIASQHTIHLTVTCSAHIVSTDAYAYGQTCLYLPKNTKITNVSNVSISGNYSGGVVTADGYIYFTTGKNSPGQCNGNYYNGSTSGSCDITIN